jgi:hypothetical protein
MCAPERCPRQVAAQGRPQPKAGHKPAEPVQGDETKNDNGNRGGARKTGIESALAAGRQYTLIAPRPTDLLILVKPGFDGRFIIKSGAVLAVGLTGYGNVGRVANSDFQMEVSNVKSCALQPV